MKQYKIKNTFPKPIAPIIDINGLPIKQTDETLKKRIINFFRASFCSFRATAFKTDNGSDWKEYCDFLYEMTNDPKELFGLVAIDGHHYDHLGSGDRGMVFNFGIPMLRGRKKFKLDRIYVYMEKRSGGKSIPHIRYWNSLCENGEEINFQWSKKIGAWHPHIQNGSPCLGRYETALADQWSNGYVVIYLRTINQFLNTWNRQSPYWDINHSPVDSELIYQKSNRHKRHVLKFKESKVINPIRDILGDENWRSRGKVKDFIRMNFFKINSGSVSYDINFLIGIYKLCDDLRYSTRIEKALWDKLGRELTIQLKQITMMAQEGQDNEYYDFSVFNKYLDGRLIRARLPNDKCNGIVLHQIDVKDGLNQYLLHNELDEHRIKVAIVRSLSWFFQKIYMSIVEGKTSKQLLDNLNIEDYAIRLNATYLNKIENQSQKLFDSLTEKNNATCRISWTSHEPVCPEKAAMIKKHYNRSQRIKNMLKAKVSKSMEETDINPYFNDWIKRYFRFSVYPHNTVMGDGYMSERGEFWPTMNISTTTDTKFKLVEQHMPEIPTTLEECLIVYSKFKKDVLALENKVLLGCHKKLIRRLEKTNVQINNTQENRRQVPLFFE